MVGRAIAEGVIFVVDGHALEAGFESFGRHCYCLRRGTNTNLVQAVNTIASNDSRRSLTRTSSAIGNAARLRLLDVGK